MYRNIKGMKTPLLGKNLEEINKLLFELIGNKDQSKGIAISIYKRNISSFQEINSIPLKLRKILEEKFSSGKYLPIDTVHSIDSTVKYLFQNEAKQRFETVYMPSLKRNTLCVSTQSGCRMGCSFCITGKIGFKGNLSTLDILNQYLIIPEWKKVNRIVLMGMGEPFDNYDIVEKAVKILTSQWGCSFGASNITISTIGIFDQLERFLEKPFCNLAISLHSPFSEERQLLMVIEKTNPIAEIIELLKKKPIQKPLRLSFEYVALGGINTSKKHANAISELLSGLKYHLNIICWNKHEGSMYNSPTELELKAFISCLNKNGVLTTVRESRGQDIEAACGQMAGKIEI